MAKIKKPSMNGASDWQSAKRFAPSINGRETSMDEMEQSRCGGSSIVEDVLNITADLASLLKSRVTPRSFFVNGQSMNFEGINADSICILM